MRVQKTVKNEFLGACAKKKKRRKKTKKKGGVRSLPKSQRCARRLLGGRVEKRGSNMGTGEKYRCF